MGIFKKRDRKADAPAHEYIEHEADRFLASPFYGEFLAWAERNGLQPLQAEENPIPWQVAQGTKFRQRFLPVILAGSDPVQISYIHVALEGLEQIGEIGYTFPWLEAQAAPSLEMLDSVIAEGWEGRAQEYFDQEADRLLRSPVYKEFLAFAERNDLRPMQNEGMVIPWQAVEGTKYRERFLPVIAAGSEPVEISYFRVALEPLDGSEPFSEPLVSRLGPSIDELESVLEDGKSRLNGRAP